MRRCFVAIALVGMAALTVRVDRHGDDAIPLAEDFARTGMETAPPVPTANRILAGMDKTAVRGILGDPIHMHELRWSYEPSWVEFRCDKVVDWYSSPLRPLRVSSGYGPISQAINDGSVASTTLPVPDNTPCD